jgi:hypothetical protein
MSALADNLYRPSGTGSMLQRSRAAAAVSVMTQYLLDKGPFWQLAETKKVLSSYQR